MKRAGSDDRDQFVALAAGAGFSEEWHLTDDAERFSVFLLASA